MDIRKNLLNSYTIPNRKMKLFTYNFLKRLRNELLKYRIDEKESYYGFYLQIEGTINYYSALRTTCEEFNVKNHYISVKLSRIRESLKKYLKKEGFDLW